MTCFRVLGECCENYKASTRLYTKRYLQHASQSREVIMRLSYRMRIIGQLQPYDKKSNKVGKRFRYERAVVTVNPNEPTV